MRKLKNPVPEYWDPDSKKNRNNTQVIYDGDLLQGLGWGVSWVGILLILNHSIWHTPWAVIIIYNTLALPFSCWWSWMWRDSGVWINTNGISIVTMRKTRASLTWGEINTFYLSRRGIFACTSVTTVHGKNKKLVPTIDGYATYGKARMLKKVEALNAAAAFYSTTQEVSPLAS
jgi:hypothetical protein